MKILQYWVQYALQRDDAHDIICPPFVLDDPRKLESHLIESSSASRILTSACNRLMIESNYEIRVIYEKLIIDLTGMYAQLT